MFKSKPVHNDQLEWEKNDEGEVVVTLKRGDSWKVRTLSKIFWIPDKTTLLLDEIGAEVWDMCDGRTTVEA
ncbi:MAG: PqqD family protein, partial [Candidatus Latescibacteria bacterium]|nr:PqqD family protein [Candidatus Latescibacterota bacterium]